MNEHTFRLLTYNNYITWRVDGFVSNSCCLTELDDQLLIKSNNGSFLLSTGRLCHGLYIHRSLYSKAYLRKVYSLLYPTEDPVSPRKRQLYKFYPTKCTSITSRKGEKASSIQKLLLLLPVSWHRSASTQAVASS